MGASLRCAGCQSVASMLVNRGAFVNATLELRPTAATRPTIHRRGSRLRAVAPLPRRVLDPATDTLTQRKLQPLKEIRNHEANYRAVHSVVAN